MSVEEKSRTFVSSGGLRLIKWTWEADAGGGAIGGEVSSVSGKIASIKATPIQIEGNYKVAVRNKERIDVLQGACTDTEMPYEVSANDNMRVPVDGVNGLPFVIIDETLTIEVSEAADGEQGEFCLNIEL